MTKIDTSPRHISSLGMEVADVDSEAWQEVARIEQEGRRQKSRLVWERPQAVRVAHELVDIIFDIGSGGLPIKLANALLADEAQGSDLRDMIDGLGLSNITATPAIMEHQGLTMEGIEPVRWLEILQQDKRFCRLFNRGFDLINNQAGISEDINLLKRALWEDLWIHYELICLAGEKINNQFPDILTPTWCSQSRYLQEGWRGNKKLSALSKKFHWPHTVPNLGQLMAATRQVLAENKTELGGVFDGIISEL